MGLSPHTWSGQEVSSSLTILSWQLSHFTIAASGAETHFLGSKNVRRFDEFFVKLVFGCKIRLSFVVFFREIVEIWLNLRTHDVLTNFSWNDRFFREIVQKCNRKICDMMFWRNFREISFFFFIIVKLCLIFIVFSSTWAEYNYYCSIYELFWTVTWQLIREIFSFMKVLLDFKHFSWKRPPSRVKNWGLLCKAFVPIWLIL